MNKRTKSELLKPTRNINPKADESSINLGQVEASHLQLQLNSLKSKLQQSKPILESIYDKVKRKEQKYHQQIRQQQDRCEKFGELTKQYRNLHHQSLKIIHKNDVIAQYHTSNNYRSCQQSDGNLQNNQLQKRTLQNYQSLKNLNSNKLERNGGIKEIIEKYKRKSELEPQKSELNHKQSKSVYQKYKSKLVKEQQDDKGKENRESTLNKIRRLSKEIDQDIEGLKLIKTKSANLLKKPERVQLKLERHPKKDQKEYFLELQRRKLKNM